MIKARDTLRNLANYHEWIKGVELGVWDGATLFYLLRYCPMLSMVGIDNWSEKGSSDDKDKETGVVPYNPVDAAMHKRAVLEDAKKWGGRCGIIVGDSAKCATQFEDFSLDFVFVDADHRTDAIIADCEAWRSKIRSGGMMLGHDEDWPSVRKGLQQVFPAWAKMAGNVWAVRI